MGRFVRRFVRQPGNWYVSVIRHFMLPGRDPRDPQFLRVEKRFGHGMPGSAAEAEAWTFAKRMAKKPPRYGGDMIVVAFEAVREYVLVPAKDPGGTASWALRPIPKERELPFLEKALRRPVA